MNTNEHENDVLRWQLHGLRRDIQPGHDLWPSIAARIAVTAQVTQPRRKRAAAWLPMAMAASLLLALGAFWRFGPAPVGDPLIRSQAAAMSQQYQRAFEQLASANTSAHPEVDSAIHTLDHSAAQIRNAIDRSPDSRFLLEQLRRTYARRLALTQRATDLT
jgi:hypothetical protein